MSLSLSFTISPHNIDFVIRACSLCATKPTKRSNCFIAVTSAVSSHSTLANSSRLDKTWSVRLFFATRYSGVAVYGGPSAQLLTVTIERVPRHAIFKRRFQRLRLCASRRLSLRSAFDCSTRTCSYGNARSLRSSLDLYRVIGRVGNGFS